MAENTTATAAYEHYQQDAAQLLAAIAAKLERHRDSVSPDELHWGHVGDLKHICAELTQVLAF